MNAATPKQLLDALKADPLTLTSLPPRTACPGELIAAVQTFEAGDRAAAQASARWLRKDALDQYGSARSWVWIGQGRVHAFFALSVGVGKLLSGQLEGQQAGPWPLPAVLLAQAARNPSADLAAGAILRSAIGLAERTAQLVGIGALMLDPYDHETAEMWLRKGFHPIAEKPRGGRPARLWYPIGAS